MNPQKVDGLPLAHLKAGEWAVVTGLAGGRRVLGRMVSLGFTPGIEVLMVQNFGNGALIVQVRDAHIALGRGEAHKILVVPRRKTERS